MTTTLVETNNRAEARMVAAIVAAFVTDPAARWMYPDPQQYLTHFPDFVRAFGGKAFEHDTAEDADGFRCAALWLPPGVQPEETAVAEVLQRSLEEERLPELFSLFEQMDAFHPSEPHWHLPLIGVDPCEQGRGCGSVLLRNGLARCDADGLPAYLEATSLRNISLYERFGFKAVGRIRTKTSPSIIPMLRPPQT
jgi:ribosomal protein S18 acetylase RimI-like enzyme